MFSPATTLMSISRTTSCLSRKCWSITRAASCSRAASRDSPCGGGGGAVWGMALECSSGIGRRCVRSQWGVVAAHGLETALANDVELVLPDLEEQSLVASLLDL